MKSEVVKEVTVNSIQEFINEVINFDCPDKCTVYFRGETEDFKENALNPSVYRKSGYLENEHRIYREIQRFNDYEFTEDKSTFDKLSRMQHYKAPTRLIDLSEDALTALYFAINERISCENAVVYVTAIEDDKIKYYDSDAVAVVANLVKLPLNSESEKSKTSIAKDAKELLEEYTNKCGCTREDRLIEKYNEKKSTKFLLHEIKEDKSYFSSIIDPRHIFSVQCVKPKLTNTRIVAQKGAFLLFGLNPKGINSSIRLINKNPENNEFTLFNDSPYLIRHPIKKILKINVSCLIKKEELKKIGITTPYIYTGLEKISEHLRAIYGVK